MKPLLSHLAAAAMGALLLFLLLPKTHNPASSPPPSRTTKSSSASTRPSEPAADLLARRNGEEPTNIEDGDFEAFNRKIGIVAPTREQLEEYLAARNRDPEALMAAGLILRDVALLKEAADKAPDNPLFLMPLAGGAYGTEAEQLEWRQRLAAMDPDNPMASYLLAASLLKSGDSTATIDLLRAAANKPGLEDYSIHTMLAVEDAYRNTGSTPVGAKVQSTFNLAMPQPSALLDLSRSLGANQDARTPDEQQEIRNITAGIGTRLARDLPFPSLLTELVGMSIQINALKGLAKDAPSPFEGLTAAEANASLEERLDQVRSNRTPDMDTLATLPPGLLEAYIDRSRHLGELEATQWLNRQIERGERN